MAKFAKGLRHKSKVVALVEPKGRVRAFKVEKANAETVRNILVLAASGVVCVAWRPRPLPWVVDRSLSQCWRGSMNENLRASGDAGSSYRFTDLFFQSGTFCRSLQSHALLPRNCGGWKKCDHESSAYRRHAGESR